MRHPLLSATAAAFLVASGVGAASLSFGDNLSGPAPVRADAQADARLLYDEGRELLKAGKPQAAYAAFSESARLWSDGRALACMAYIKASSKGHEEAIQLIDEAIDAGLKSARVLNNRGYSQMMLHEAKLHAKQHQQAESAFDAANRDFSEAIRLDLDLQAPRYNRGKLALRRVLTDLSWDIPEDMLVDMRKAVGIGPVSRALAYDAARLLGLALKDRPELRDDVIQYLRQAIERGQDARQAGREYAFNRLKSDEGFRSLLSIQSGREQTPQELQLIDPLPDAEPIAAR
jgi:tetratricopeptide (TPR) repeat protein